MKEFQRVIEEMISLFKQFTGIEQMKLKAATENRVATVEECMTKEQALVLKLKGLEQEREKYQKEAGYGGMKFREILAAVSDEEREILYPLFDGLSRQIQMFQEVNEDAEKVMSNNLRMIKKALDRKEGGIYSEKGKSETVTHMTSRRV